MLKTTGLSNFAQRDDNDEVVEGNGDRNMSKSKKSKNAKPEIQTFIRATGESIFLILSTKKAFN